MDKLQSLFFPYEVEAIRRVPVASPNDKDTRFWRFEKKGSYPVKTGYWTSFKTNEYTSRANSEASSSQKDPFWKTLWGLNIPKKVKIFIWKAAHDIIASEVNLVQHHVPGNRKCVLCGFFWYDTAHTLFFCQVSKAAW